MLGHDNFFTVHKQSKPQWRWFFQNPLPHWLVVKFNMFALYNITTTNLYAINMGKLQITPLKFGVVWILHPDISKFRFYSLKFGMFRYYILTF